MKQQLESMLDGWRGWDIPPGTRPAFVRELGGGRSNRSFLLEAAGERMVLRVNAAEATLPGAGRQQEAEIWRAASNAGIAPPLLHADPGGDFLVSAYIESNLPNRPQDDQALAEQALALLERCHRLEVATPSIDYSSYIELYWRAIETRGLEVGPQLLGQRAVMRSVLEEIAASGAATGLCHHDPVVANFVGTSERLYLLDWEYAARGLAVIDFAALAVEWGIDNEIIGAHAGIEPTLLDRAKAFYRYMCTLWDVVLD
ncbi:MAG: phosphotransferase [Lysobacterales bacterium]